jgi:diguanylate cyclase (GGDEF)-like protein/PAS domain S-box-containing protein
MPVLESLTIAAGIGAFGFLAYYLRRRLATRGPDANSDTARAGGAGPGSKPEAPGNGRKDSQGAGSDRPMTVLIDQDLFSNLAESMDAAVLIHDETIHYANAAAARIFAVPRVSLRGSRLEEYVHPEQRETLSHYLERRSRGGSSRDIITVQILDPEDRAQWVEIRPFDVNGPMNGGQLGSIIRPSPMHQLEAARESGRGLARRTLDAVGEGIITTDVDGRIDYVNSAAEAIIGCRRDMAVGRVLTELVSLVDEADRRPLGDPVARCLQEGARIDLGRRSLLIALASGEEHSIELSASPIRTSGPDYQGAVILLHDVSEIRGLARQMSYQASHDPLTGLANRREFERRLEDVAAGARSGSATHVLCYLDLDRFKVVNDSCGHIAGDNLLRELAGLIRGQVRDSDLVARIGGDEFGMLLVGCPLEKARQIADDVCSAIRDFRFVWRDRIFTVGVSIGLVEMGHEIGTIEELLGAADSACYVAKQKGRGRVHVYSARDEAVARQRGEILWLQRIQKALKEDDFELFLQPIVSVAGRVDTGPAYEVLLRLRGDDNAIITPADFMQAAERYHLMPNVDRWVLQATFSAIGSGSLKLPDRRSCTINLSGQTLGDPQFLDYVVDCLDRSGVTPDQICFEVRESSVIDNLSHAARFIAVLHGMGCQFALDDFGSGLGAFSNLRSLAMDYLKIDGSIIRGLGEDHMNEAMVTAMISLARTMDIRVIAEHVENESVFEVVRQMGVDFAQGFAVGRPEPFETH